MEKETEGKCEVSKITGSESLSVLDSSTSAKAGQDKTLEIAEKLHKLENELEVNLFEQFELFLRTHNKDETRSIEGNAVETDLKTRESRVLSEEKDKSRVELDQIEVKEAVCEEEQKVFKLESSPRETGSGSCAGDYTEEKDYTEEEDRGAEIQELLDNGGPSGEISCRKRSGSPMEGEENAQESKISKQEDVTQSECQTLVGDNAALPGESPPKEKEEDTIASAEGIQSDSGLGIAQEGEQVLMMSTVTVETKPEAAAEVEAELGLMDADRVEVLPLSFTEDPPLLTTAKDEFLLYEGNNFLKGCKWSPDGTCILTNSEDGVLRLFNLPGELYFPKSWTPVPDLTSVLKMVEGELIYDYCWYPLMSSLQPETCCFVSSCRGHPVHMWDAFDGEMRCSYRPHNHMDDLITPHSLGFSLDGSKLYCGFSKLIKVFDTTRPGKDCQSRQTKGKLGGQTGIISCFAMDPNGKAFAAGSYSKTIGVYTDSCPSPITLLWGQASGVTHLMYSLDGCRIYSGSRMDTSILCWDVRKSSEVLYSMERNVTTNQRMYFDIDPEDHYLVSGNQDGKVTIWDLNQDCSSSTNSSLPVLDPLVQFKANEDTTNGVSLHPSLPLLATASGQRTVSQPSAGSDGESDEEEEAQRETPERTFHNSLKIWSLYVNR